MSIKTARAEIDEIDAEIIKLLKKRFELSREIGKIKRQLKKDIEDGNRDQEVVNNYRKRAENKLSEDFLEDLVRLILKYSKEAQKE
jgi:chorismate mutase/prephenate dehydratase